MNKENIIEDISNKMKSVGQALAKFNAGDLSAEEVDKLKYLNEYVSEKLTYLEDSKIRSLVVKFTKTDYK